MVWTGSPVSADGNPFCGISQRVWVCLAMVVPEMVHGVIEESDRLTFVAVTVISSVPDENTQSSDNYRGE